MNLLFDPHMIWIFGSALLIYWIGLRKEIHRDYFLFTLSVGLLASLHPIFAASSVAMTAALWIYSRNGRGRWGVLIAIIVFWMIVKYGPDIVEKLSLPGDFLSRIVVVPLGISYLAVRLIQFVLESSRGQHRNTGFGQLGSFLFFFPTLSAGPIESFRGFFSARSNRFDSDFLGYGIRRMMWGYFKKLFIGDLVLEAVSRPWVKVVLTAELSSLQPLPILVFCAVMFVRAYVDLSAYTDIAIGASRMFGFRISENFHQPFLKENLVEFWRGWHITLSRWCRENIYFPVLGWKRNPVLALTVSMVFMGLWHQIHLNWVLWGVFHAVGLAALFHLSRIRSPRVHALLRNPILRPVKIMLTFWYVALGYLFVAVPDTARSLGLLRQLLL